MDGQKKNSALLKDYYDMQFINPYSFKSRAIPTDGLIAYYPFNGNANDKSGNNYDGTIHGTVTATTDRNGKSNHAYDFDGSTGYIDISNFDYSWVNSNFSISLWFYQDSLGSGKRILGISKGTSTDSIYINILQNNTDLTFLISTDQLQMNPGNSIPAGNWYHVVIISDSGVMKMFVNNIECNSTTNIATTLSGIDSFSIGSLPFNGNHTGFFDGKIDDIRIYNRVLTADEISAIYNE